MFYESSEAWVLDRAEIAVSELEPKVEPRIGKSGLLCFSTLNEDEKENGWTQLVCLKVRPSRQWT